MQNGAKHWGKKLKQDTGSDYRPDIDGLRAIAVTLVVLHHVGVGFVKGGYIGVDIFFVISGYLITGILLREMEAGSFSVLNFYRRRARRIFPALAVVFAFSSLAASLLLFPNELSYFGTSLITATFFVANILFFYGQGYFAGTGETIPLLHTWSLSVEEQFYIFFPLILWWATKRGHIRPVVLVAVLAAVSFALNIYLVELDRSSAFFLFPPRAWELLLGCLLATRALPDVPARYREGAAAVALVTIIAATGIFNRSTIFPGWAALAPCLAATILIHVGGSGPTLVGRLLSSRPFVYIGLISYSLYLWHWPLIVFYRAHTGFNLSTIEKIGLCLASVAIAHMSWRFVEQPFRTGSLKKVNIFAWSGFAAAAASACALVFLATNGLASRYPEAVRRFAAFDYAQGVPFREGVCFISRTFARDPHVDDKCLAMVPSKPNYLIIGDSHAAQYWAGFQEVLPEVNFLQATASGCKPTIGSKGADRCRSVIDHALNTFIPNAKLDAIVISAYWTQGDLNDLRTTVKYLEKYVPKVIIMGPIVTYDDFVPRLLARSEAMQDREIVRRARSALPRQIDQAFAQAFPNSGAIQYISVIDLLCGPTYECITLDSKGLPLQFDRAHLTAGGAAEVAKLIRQRRIAF